MMGDGEMECCLPEWCLECLRPDTGGRCTSPQSGPQKSATFGVTATAVHLRTAHPTNGRAAAPVGAFLPHTGAPSRWVTAHRSPRTQSATAVQIWSLAIGWHPQCHGMGVEADTISPAHAVLTLRAGARGRPAPRPRRAARRAPRGPRRRRAGLAPPPRSSPRCRWATGPWRVCFWVGPTQRRGGAHFWCVPCAGGGARRAAAPPPAWTGTERQRIRRPFL